MIPAYAHIALEILVKAGFPDTKTVGLPGDQGAVIMGIQGCGVNTPNAAAVAEATAGFAKDVHIPNVGKFIAVLSIIDAKGREHPSTFVTDVTTKLQGATPKLH